MLKTKKKEISRPSALPWRNTALRRVKGAPVRLGFSLIELLVVIVIIAILATISAIIFIDRQNSAHVAAAEFELGQLKRLVAHLESETSRSPGGIAVRPCVTNTQVQMQGCDAGIQCNDGRFGPDWSGPYGDASDFLDPWNQDYWFIADYRCDQGTENPVGCTGFSGVTLRVVASSGPDQAPQSSGNLSAGADDIILVMCAS